MFFRARKLTFEVYHQFANHEKIKCVINASQQTKLGAKELRRGAWPETSMAKCPAFFLSQQEGFILRMPFTVKVTIYANGEYHWWSSMDDYHAFDLHSRETYQPYFDGHVALKFRCPIFIKEKTGQKCAFMAPWQFNKSIGSKWHGASGFIDFKYNNACNVFCMFPIPKDGENTVWINAGDPIAHIVPLTDKKYEIEYKQDRLFTPINTTAGSADKPSYLNMKQLIDEAESMHIKGEGGCPFKWFRK